MDILDINRMVNPMNKMKQTEKLTLSGLFLALALLLPFLTGQIPQVGAMLCPMHIPVLLCGFLCGGPMGLLVGFIAPLLRSAMFGMPPLFPEAFCMAFELAVYGAAAGFFYSLLPKRKAAVLGALVCAMVLGRLVWGAAMVLCVGMGSFGWATFLSGAVLSAVPGIVLQLVLVPVIVHTMEKYLKQKQ